MRKIYYYISAAVIALGLASCNKSEVDSANYQITIIANTENSVDTKTYLSGDDAKGYKVLWSEGDKIFLRDRVYNKVFILKEGAGSTIGTFVPTQYEELTDGKTYDIYYATPGTELYTTSSYEPGNVISSIPMKGTVTYQDGVASVTELKNLCGLLRLSLTGSGTVKQIKVSADQLLSGECRISADYSMRMIYGLNYVIQDCGDGVELSGEKTDFYISLPPNDYKDVKIEITDFSGNTCVKTLKSDKTLNISRALITPVSITVTGLSHNTPGSLAGEFTVKDPDGTPNSGDETKVKFSRGNLYWDGDSFELEANQSDCQNSWNSSHVRYFYWSSTPSDAYSNTYVYPYHDISTDVIFTNDPVAPFNSERADKANAHFTVNGVTGEYRTLSMSEWWYLFENHSHKWVTVNDVQGCVIAPDGVSFDSSKNTYTSVELNSGNLVFLPAAGKYRDGSVNFFDRIGNYWASTVYSYEGSAMGYEYVCFDNENSYRIDHGYELNNAFSIRLVTDINN